MSLLRKHPSWIKRKHSDALEPEWVDSLPEALKWAIAKGSLRRPPAREIEPTYKGMIPEPFATEGDSHPSHVREGSRRCSGQQFCAPTAWRC